LEHFDIFSGIGGFALAAKWAGFRTVKFVEIDTFCQKVLEKNFPGVPIDADVRQTNGAVYRGRIRLLTGGFPCQDVSEAGRGAGLSGARSGLWTEMRRLICEIQPEFVVVENVSGLLHRGINRVLGDLAELRYDAEWGVFSSCRLGSPHTRERVFIVAYPTGKRFQILAHYQRTKGYCPEGMGEVTHQASQRTIRVDGRSRMQVPEHLRVCNGVSAGLDSHSRIHALGNAIDPRVAYPILQAIAETLT
jgi:DNA (cytosine-5)-methyltransferase 1